VYCADSNAVFVNCTIADNANGELGAGVCLINSDVVLANSILWGNTAGHILVDNRSVPSVVYSDVAGGWLGEGNLDADPLFIRRGYWADANDPEVVLGADDPDGIWIAGDYHLCSQGGRWDGATQTWVQDEATSPCLDAGDPDGPVGDEPVPHGGIINLGAYGGTAGTVKSPEIH